MKRFLILLIFYSVNSRGSGEIQLRYSPGLIKWFNSNYEEFNRQLYVGINHQFSIQYAILNSNSRIHYSVGLQYSNENNLMKGKIILTDEKYQSTWIKNYRSYFIEIPIGISLKLNNSETRHTSIKILLINSIFSHEKYFFHDGMINYLPNQNPGYYNELNAEENHWGYSRLILAIGAERQTKIGNRLTLIRGAGISLPNFISTLATPLGFTNFRINGIIGLGFNKIHP